MKFSNERRKMSGSFKGLDDTIKPWEVELGSQKENLRDFDAEFKGE